MADEFLAIGAGRTARIWSPFHPRQDPLDSKTDYFDDASLDAKWEEWDVDNTITVAEDSEGVVLTNPASALTVRAGLIQPIPAHARYVIDLNVRPRYCAGTGNGYAAGLVWGEDLSVATGNPSTGDFFFWGIAQTNANTTPSLNFQRYSSYAAWIAHITSGWHFPCGMVSDFILRLFIDTVANTVAPLLSVDGKDWLKFHEGYTPWFVTPASMGFAMHNARTGGEDALLRSRMFRVKATTDPFDPLGGYIG